MTPTAPSNCVFLKRRRERGQALIYGIFVLMGGLAALFFLFNTGQLSSEKSKLVNTADAVAYSAGVMHARALNFDAYNNRALVANEVLVAQMVSLSSWAQYAKTHADNVGTVFPECNIPIGTPAGAIAAAAGALVNYGPLYVPMCSLTVQYSKKVIDKVAKQVPQGAEKMVSLVEGNKILIKAAQSLLHAPWYFQQMRSQVMQEVANRNYLNDGSVTVEPVGGLSSSGLTDDWRGFTKRYADDDRGRFAEVAKLAAYRDEFVRERSWNATALIPHLDPWCFGRHNEVRRRGGTELIGYDEWKAEDTESFHSWRVKFRRFSFPRCIKSETEIGWGEQQAHPSGQDEDESGAYLGGSPSTNRNAHSLASSDEWTDYTGLPAFYDLDPDWLKKGDPRLQFSVRVVRASGQTRTSDGQSQISPSAHLNAYQDNFARGEMAAVSSSEVFFERSLDHKENLFGSALRPSKPREIGSLFNPYWQVRLIHSEKDVSAQRTYQMN